MIHLDNIKKIVCIIFLMILSNSCSQSTKPANMKWISKYDFYDIYQKNINNGLFPPVTGLNLKIFKFLDENTMFLAGSKDLYDFYNKPGDSAVLFVSKDRGKIYKEITFPEENITNLTLSKKYSLVETNSRGFSSMGKNVIYLFNNETLYFEKIDEYSSNNKISYNQFNGQFVIYSKDTEKKVLNIFTKEKYNLPIDVTEKNYILSDTGADITFLKEGNKIVVYNAISKTYKIIKELKNSYTTIMDTFGEIYLGKTNLIKTSGTIYDLNENELFEVSPKTEKKLYRYKNFACKFKETRPYTTFSYSYDYGKTWYEYHTKDFFTTIIPKGYYKDKYMLLDFCSYDTKNKTSIMIGEFQK